MRKIIQTMLGVVALVLILPGAGCTTQDTNNETVKPKQQKEIGQKPNILVENQQVNNGAVVIKEVVATTPSWVVIHADDSGNPGEVIGQGLIAAGVQRNVSIEIDTVKATPRLFAMLHTDSGTPGAYEFPGADAPVNFEGKNLTSPFTVAVKIPSTNKN